MTVVDTIPMYYIQDWAAVVGVILIIATIVSMIIAARTEDKGIITVFVMSGITLLILLLLISTGILQYYDHDEYMIEFDDTVSINEIYSKYEVISKEKYSNIYRVKEK